MYSNLESFVKGILNPETGLINNEASLRRLTQIAIAFADAGCQVIAPSDMMDSRISAIKDGLKSKGLLTSVCVMSYSSKFSSGFYGPFRYDLNLPLINRFSVTFWCWN